MALRHVEPFSPIIFLGNECHLTTLLNIQIYPLNHLQLFFISLFIVFPFNFSRLPIPLSQLLLAVV